MKREGNASCPRKHSLKFILGDGELQKGAFLKKRKAGHSLPGTFQAAAYRPTLTCWTLPLSLQGCSAGDSSLLFIFHTVLGRASGSF